MAATVVVKILGDVSALEGALDKAGSGLQQTAGKFMSLGTKMSLGITGPLGLLGKTAIDASSDVEESLSKVRTVFGDSSIAIEKFADHAAKNMGLSRQQALDMAGSFGNMFTQLGIGASQASLMSQQMGLLAADLASFHNADVTDVIEAQASAFRGEYDSVQKYVPTINAASVEQKALAMTSKATTKELTAQDKALAVQTLLVEGAGKATGDFARTSDGLANSQRIATAEAANAQATLGKGLQPIMQKVTEVASKLAEKFAGLSSGWQTAIVIGAALLFALGPIVTVIGAMTAAVGALSGAMVFLAANPIVLVIAAVAALGAGLVLLYKNSETFRNVVNGAFEGVKTAVQAVWSVIRPIFNVWLKQFEMIQKAAKGIGKAISIVGKAGSAVGGVLGKIPGFDDGGVVPGPRGSPQLVLAHGGETVLPTHKGPASTGGMNVTYNISAADLPSRDALEMANRDLGWRLGAVGGV